MRAFPLRSGLLNRPAVRSGRNLRRKLSFKGAIKKTRSIAVERKPLFLIKPDYYIVSLQQFDI